MTQFPFKAGASALALGAALAALPAVAQETLVINSFGGAYEEAHRALVIEPFEEMHDVEIEVVTAYSADALAQLRAQRDNPQFDVIHFSGGQEVIAAEEGLLVPIQPDELSTLRRDVSRSRSTASSRAGGRSTRSPRSACSTTPRRSRRLRPAGPTSRTSGSPTTSC